MERSPTREDEERAQTELHDADGTTAAKLNKQTRPTLPDTISDDYSDDLVTLEIANPLLGVTTEPTP
jgi:hypothetical protein